MVKLLEIKFESILMIVFFIVMVGITIALSVIKEKFQSNDNSYHDAIIYTCIVITILIVCIGIKYMNPL